MISIISWRLDCLFFLPQQCHDPSCRSVCLPVHLVHQSILSSQTEKATHLTLGQLSKQDTLFTLTPEGGRRLTIHSVPWVNLFTSGIDPEHCWHTGLSLEWNEYVILRTAWGGGALKAENMLKLCPHMFPVKSTMHIMSTVWIANPFWVGRNKKKEKNKYYLKGNLKCNSFEGITNRK